MAEPESAAGYGRSQFPHWANQGGGCDTRETVLARDGRGVEADSDCRPVAGSWYSLYDGAEVPQASGIDIDHMVPLFNAWISGASHWSQGQRKQFANDLDHPQLYAVSARTHRDKGTKSPDQWAPPNRDSWCEYGRAWIDVKAAYSLTITQAEKNALRTLVNTCD
ncbi:DUF1524 domain-containing protein [Streptomyces sp. NPDC089919]|uniref:GmrSD restriction endonuclease domain-containing protein n=1 Tax=Streptomyces sp. NPDC089919 TaxID=3155188 RepID=UPI003420771A